MKTLLISRCPQTQRRLIDALAQRRHEVALLEDVEAACAALQSGGYPLVILDADLSDGQAVELCRRLRAVPQSAAHLVLAVGGVGETEQIGALLEAGADDYLADPADPQQLAARLAVAEHRLARGDQPDSELPEGFWIGRFPLLRDAPYGVFKATPEAKFLEVNPALVAMLGYDCQEELLGANSPHDICRDPDARRHILTELTDRGRVAGAEMPWNRKDGSPITVMASACTVCDESGAVSHVEGIIHDITKQKEAEKALQKSEGWFRSLIELGVTVFAVLDAQGKVLYESPNLEQIYGWKPEELVGQSIFEHVHPDDVEYAIRNLGELVAEPGLVKTVEVRYRHKNGSWRTLEVSGVNLLDDPAVGGVVLSSFDVTERTRAEEALRNSEKQYRTLVETAQEGIGITDLHENIVFANQAFANLLGYTKEELLRLNLRELSDDAEFDRYTQETAKRQRGEASRYETKLYTKTGQPRWISLSAAPIHDERGNVTGTLGLLTDVTQHRQAADQLRQSEQRYRLIADNVADVICTVSFDRPVDPADLATGEHVAAAAEEVHQHWRFDYISPSVERVFGYSLEEAMQLSPEELLAPDSHAIVMETLADELARERSEPAQAFRERTLELQYLHKDGSTCWCEVVSTFLRDDRGRPTGALSVLRDVTRRRETERAIREHEATLSSLFDNLPDFVLLVDRHATIRFVNRGTPGVTAEEMLGATGFNFIVPEHQQQRRHAFEQAFATGQTQEVEALDVAGYWWACRVVPMFEDGQVHNAMVICTDVTQTKQAAEAVQKEQRLLRQLLDLHEGDRRLIAYEIHDGAAQQLTAALYNLQAFEQLSEHDSDQARQIFDAGLELLTRSITEIRRLISGLRPPILDESGIVAAVDYLVCEAREREKQEIEFFHKVQFDRLAPPLESAIFRIVQESLTNACRHSGTDKVRIELVQHNGRIEVSVRDWGIGFEPEKVEEHRFGLQGIRERARLLGGQVTIQTAADEGTCIAVELPLVEAAPE